jgi:copper(I)-binding protein
MAQPDGLRNRPIGLNSAHAYSPTRSHGDLLKLLFGPALAVLLAATAAHAAPSQLQISRAWSRPAVAGTNGSGYLVVANHGSKADAVTGVQSPLAARIDMHAMSMAGGVMSMRRVDRVAVPAGGQAEFGPGGYHLMLMGLTRTLKPGDHAPVTITFASGAKLKADLTVSVNPPA